MRSNNSDCQLYLSMFSKIVLLGFLASGLILLSSCGSAENAKGKIMGAYQPLRSGMVQMYIEVELDDGTKVDALLPMRPPYKEDQKIWDKVSDSLREGNHLRVEIQREGPEKTWEFVRFLDEEKQTN